MRHRDTWHANVTTVGDKSLVVTTDAFERSAHSVDWE